MHETKDDIEALTALIEKSYAAAGSHMLSIHTNERRLSASDVCAVLSGVCVLDLATVNSHGAPYVAPVDGLFFRGRFWFCSDADSLRFRHIRKNARVSAAHTRGEALSIIVHGTAREVDTSRPGHEDLRAYCREVYGPSYDEWGYWGRFPFAFIDPNKFFACRMPGSE